MSVLAALLAASAAFGQSSGGDEEPPADVVTERIVVTASRTERDTRQVPVVAIVLDAEDLEAAPDVGLLDVGRQIPSLVTSRDNGNLIASPRAQSFSFRGIGAGNVSRGLLLFEGVPLMDPYNQAVIWSQVPKDLVERVEVVRGGGSSAWGNLALSGVINLIARRPQENLLAATMRGGSKSTVDASVSYGDVGEKWTGWLGADYFDTDGYFDRRPEDRGSVDIKKKRRYFSLNGRATRTLSAGAVLGLDLRTYNEDRVEGTPIQQPENEDLALGAKFDTIAGSAGSWSLRLFARDSQLDDSGSSVNADRSAEEPRNVIHLPTSSAGFGAVWTGSAGQTHALNAGVDLFALSIERNEQRDWDDGFHELNYVEGRQNLGGIFVEDNLSLGSATSLQLAVRQDWIRTFDGRTVDTDLDTGGVVETIHQDNTESTFNPRLGLVHAFAEDWRLRAAAYRGFRAPNPRELWTATAPRGNRLNTPNPELVPETMVGSEVGIEHAHGRRFVTRVTGFWAEVDDLIQRLVIDRTGDEPAIIEPCGLVGPSGQCRQLQNLGKVRSSGVEIDGDYRPNERWRFTAAAAFLDTEILSNPSDPDLVGNQIESTPDQSFSLTVQWSGPRQLQAMLRGRWVGDRFNDAENEEPLPSYAVADLSLSLPVGDRWVIFGGVENLLDEEYEIGFSSEGTEIGAPRLFHVGLRFRSR
ncbi:MAG: TonB-dependent receptor [Thermoanaerobaculia bacterium]|nr:TonB-dependent receptor [Thermoanaerobaculia bacterium]